MSVITAIYPSRQEKKMARIKEQRSGSDGTGAEEELVEAIERRRSVAMKRWSAGLGGRSGSCVMP